MFGSALSGIEAQLPWWKARLSAWWQGEEFDPRAVGGANGASDPLETGAQMLVCQAIWGHGAISPADTALVEDLTGPWSFDEEDGARLVVLGAGLGVGVCALAKASGARISAFEVEDAFVDAATEQCILGGAAKLASVSLLDPNTPALPQSEFDGAILIEPYLRIGSALDLVPEVAVSLKPGGKLLLLDYTLPKGTWDGGELASVFGGQIADLPQTADALCEAIEQEGLTLAEQADVSDRLVDAAAAASEGWTSAVQLVESGEVDEALRETVVRVLAEEASMWAARTAAFKSGHLGFQKILAEKPA